MSEQGVDSELRRFMYERVPSYEQLEILVRLSEKRESFSADGVAETIGIPAPTALEALEGLVRATLVSEDPPGTYSYAPASPELDTLAVRLTRVYRGNRFAVVQVMTENSMRRLRGAALETFAECFRLRGPKKDG